MTVTAIYGATHDAFLTVARRHQLVPFDVRLLVALRDRGGAGRTDELAREMVVEGTAIRRSSLELRRRRFITADAGEGTRGPERGVRARLSLTDRGREVARVAAELAVRDQPVPVAFTLYDRGERVGPPAS